MRDNAKEKTVKATFPRVQTVEGSLDDKETIIQEARDADIVLSQSTQAQPRVVIDEALLTEATQTLPMPSTLGVWRPFTRV